MLGIEIIPNWHPIFVHFTVGLLSISALLYLAGLVLKKPHFVMIARWNLWIGGAITVLTVWAGFYAYGTVAHDALSHAAMTDHKNWALVTALLFATLAGWSVLKHRGANSVNAGFVILILLATTLLGITGFKGGEVVYRHGTGVMRLPVIAGDGGHGSHAHGGGVGESAPHDIGSEESQMPQSDHGNNPHGGH